MAGNLSIEQRKWIFNLNVKLTNVNIWEEPSILYYILYVYPLLAHLVLRNTFLDNLFGCIWNCSNIQYQCLFTGTITYFKGWSSNSDNSPLIQTVASCYGSLISIIISYRITVSEIKKSHAWRIIDGRRMSLYVAHAIFQQRQSKTEKSS